MPRTELAPRSRDEVRARKNAELSTPRVRELAVSGLAASLAAMVVMAVYGAGSQPIIALAGLAIAAGAFACVLGRGTSPSDPASGRAAA